MTHDKSNPTIRSAKGFRSLKADMPDVVATMKRARGRPPVSSPKAQITLRLSADIVKGIKKSGAGYTARVESVLKRALERGAI